MTKEQASALYNFLDGPEGCDFRQSDPEDVGTVTWKCDYTLTKTHQWLREHDVDRDAVYWSACCDCEVVLNFPEDLIPDEDEHEE